MTLIADLFLNLRSPKNVVRLMSKKSRFREPFDELHGQSAKNPLKSERHHLHNIY